MRKLRIRETCANRAPSKWNSTRLNPVLRTGESALPRVSCVSGHHVKLGDFGLAGGPSAKEPAWPAQEMWETRVRFLGREDPWRRAWQPTLASSAENAVDRGAWWDTVHGAARNGAWLRRLSTQHPPGALVIKSVPVNTGDSRDSSSLDCVDPLRRKWQPTPVPCLGNPMDRGARRVSCRSRSLRELDTTEHITSKHGTEQEAEGKHGQPSNTRKWAAEPGQLSAGSVSL